jgi:hypothetical protein
MAAAIVAIDMAAILECYRLNGSLAYEGEEVTQLPHAW